ncbi:MAG: hypothetical protein QOE83_916 [Actinomycetota bacterium]|jgi:uncharacterized repeat protein (TIGR01451 family)|nr:hypothetical protein [Actinomycetota bacterium]
MLLESLTPKLEETSTVRQLARIPRRFIPVLALLTVATFLVLPTTSALANTSITSESGPLTNVFTTSDLNCQVNHLDDVNGEFYATSSDSTSPACATLIAVGSALYGPSDIDAGPASDSAHAFAPVSQVGPTGSGTASDPFKIVTTVTAPVPGVDGGLEITQTDTYVEGQESYRTDVTIHNPLSTDGAVTGIIYRAGDCYLGNDDHGYGAYDAATGSIACTGNGTGRIEQWYPLSPNSHYREAQFSAMWGDVSDKTNFSDTCNCNDLLDNGAGLSWDFSVAPGASRTKSSIITFSPLGLQPLSISKTADFGTASPGGQDGYTITVDNPNADAVPLTSLTDNLPSGFTYQTGSTTGDTTSDPDTIGGDGTLTWDNPFTVPGAGSASIHFDVTVSGSNGDYMNSADGTADGYTVVGSGPTAEVLVNSTETGCPAVAPGAPTNVVAYPGNASAVVSWDPPTSDGGAPIESYTVNIYDQSSGGGFAPINADSVQTSDTSVEVTGLVNGDAYLFTVQATNCAGTGPESEFSNEITPSADSSAETIGDGNLTQSTGDTKSPTGNDTTIGSQTFPAGSSGTGTLQEIPPGSNGLSTRGFDLVHEFCGTETCIGNILQAELHNGVLGPNPRGGVSFYKLRLFLDRTLVRHLGTNVKVWYDGNLEDAIGPVQLQACSGAFNGTPCILRIYRTSRLDLKVIVKSEDLDPRLTTSK